MSTQNTFVVGFFNGNKWPLSMDITAVGIKLTLQPNEYVTVIDGTGAKVKTNDPLFEGYVGPKKLSRELSRVPVPLVKLRRSEPANQAMSHPGFTGTPSIPVLKTVQTPTQQGPKDSNLTSPAMQHAENTKPFRGMTIDEAIRQKLIPKPKPLPDDTGLKENEGAPHHGKDIPEIKYADADVRNRPNLKNLSLQPVAIPQEPPATPLAPPALPTDPAPTIPRNFTMAEINEATSDKAEAAIVAPAQEAVPDATLPVLTDKPKRFLCDQCQPHQSFTFRSGLEAHAKKNHPELLAAIMDRYPKLHPPKPPQFSVPVEQPGQSLEPVLIQPNAE